MTEIIDYAKDLPKVFESLKRDLHKRASRKYRLSLQDAEDLIQRTYLSVERTVSREGFKEVGSGVRGLVVLAFDRKCKDYLDGNRIRFVGIGEDVFFGTREVVDEVLANESLGIIYSQLDRLPEHHRQVIIDEIDGNYQGNKSEAYRSRLMRARRDLKQRLIDSGVLEIEE